MVHGNVVGCFVATLLIYLKVKIDGLPIPKGRLVKGPYKRTVPSTFQLL